MRLVFEMKNGKMQMVEGITGDTPVYIDFVNETVCAPYDGVLAISDFSEIVNEAYYNCFYKQFEKRWSCSTVNTRSYAGIEYGISPDMSYKEIEYVTGRDYDVLWHIYCEL